MSTSVSSRQVHSGRKQHTDKVTGSSSKRLRYYSKSGYMSQLVKDAIEIKLDLNNTNVEEVFKIAQHGIPAPDY
jgi:hypothetical protein